MEFESKTGPSGYFQLVILSPIDFSGLGWWEATQRQGPTAYQPLNQSKLYFVDTRNFSKSAAARRIAVMHRTYCPPPTSGRSGWFRVLGQGVSRGGMPLNIGLEDTLNLFSAAYQGERAD